MLGAARSVRATRKTDLLLARGCGMSYHSVSRYSLGDLLWAAKRMEMGAGFVVGIGVVYRV
jgi:hypothetical protein